MDNVDLSKPVEIAENTYWVGSYIQDDFFQCHSYLIKNGKESILIDPGSLITFEETLRKLKYLINLDDIKYIVCHHQDPDLASALLEIEKVFPDRERYIVTHWRTYFLLRHYNLLTPFYLVDQHEFKLELENGKELKFILTPYMHYAGNIVTYDSETKVLFSSDIFGGWTEENWSLFANGEEYIEAIKTFHETYIPCKEIVLYSIGKLKKLDIEVIAPQHGSIIKGKDFIKKIMSAVENFEYGKMIEAEKLESFRTKEHRRHILSIIKELTIKELFMSKILHIVERQISSVLPIKNIFVILKTNDHFYIYSKETNYIPRKLEKPKFDFDKNNVLIFENGNIKIFIEPKNSFSLSEEDREFLNSIASLIVHVAKREKWLLSIQEKKKLLKDKAYKDILTDLYRRELVKELIEKEFHRSKRYGYHFSILMIDIDDFKKINDTYGHLLGDKVLKKVAEIIKKELRKSDIPIRYGGEEFLIILPHTDLEAAKKVADRIRRAVEEAEIDGIKTSVSIGVADNSLSRKLEDIIKKADQALYTAKRMGKNKVVVATT
ncbi:diguanylate cyclase [Desulfurobacterium thermolithotrophum]|uniref:diguanylate cyclase n=1 Tax=Desulfurobacterium thermolithotrophum TaxID=64160 RepID=UPI0013D6260C|nr:diguanylate cyclase [Desulfurobacterium thermolithotrophum]